MSLKALCRELFESPTGKPSYDRKYMQKIPQASAVSRIDSLVAAARGRSIVDIGCAGSDLGRVLKKVASSYIGIDKEEGEGVVSVDLDKVSIPVFDNVEVVICGEVIEHLSNPGFFLDGLRKYRCKFMFTVPNAFAMIHKEKVATGYENVNSDHVAYYSWYTFTNLLKRHGFEVLKFWWADGVPGFSEGLVFLAR